MRLRLICSLALLLLVPVLAGAQTPFALNNVGQRLPEGDARIMGRGGWGMTVVDSLHPGFENPASLATVRHAVLSFTGYGESVSSTSPSSERTTSRVYTPDVRAAFPVAKSRLVLTAGFELNRSSQWKTYVDSTWTVWEDTLSGNVQFQREGTEFRVPLGVAWQATPWLALAGALNLESGSLRETLSHSYVWPSTSTGFPIYGPNVRISEDQYTGTSYTLAGLARPTPWLRLGGSWTSAHDIDVERKVEHGGVSERALSEFTLARPEEIGLGFSARLSERWHVGADLHMMNYTELTGRDDWATALEDEIGYQFGFERTRASQRRGGWSNLPLRIGAGWRQWAYQVGGNPVEEMTFSVGTGFPFRRDRGQLDVGLSYSMVGDLADNGMESEVWRLSVSVTGLEAWW